MLRTMSRTLLISACTGAAAIAVLAPTASAAPATPAAPSANAAAQAPARNGIALPDKAMQADAAAVSGHNSTDHYGSTGRCGFNLCLYYNSGQNGAAAGFNSNIYDLAGYVWPNNGAGSGQAIKNNAASAENQGRYLGTVYYNHGYAGNYDWLNPGSYGQLYYTYNENASLSIG